MRPLPIIPLRRRSASLLLCAFLACDSFKEDFIKPENQLTFSQTEFYTLPASAIVIDLRSVIEKSFVSASLTIGENPIKGTLTQMDAFVFKYTPIEDFIEGQDQFTFSAVLDDGTTIKGKPITVYMKSSEAEFPCGVYPVEDDIRMHPVSTAVIHVLQNDRICDVEEPVEVRVHLTPKFGEVVVVGGSILYTPGPSFSRNDEFVYSLSTSTGEKVSFGLVSFNKPKFEVFEIPVGFKSIFFIDDMIGFIAGRQALQKTTDGGRHWIQLTYPASEDDHIEFEDIYFLNKDHGFAAFSRPYSECPTADGWGVAVCPWEYMETKNGGTSWDWSDHVPIFDYSFQPVINLPYKILSQGFSPDSDLGVAVSGTTLSSWPARQILTVSISTDKGKTWVDLAEHPEGYPWAISVPSSNVAYILCWGKIIKYSR